LTSLCSFLEILSIFRTTRGQTCDYSSAYDEVTNINNKYRFDLGSVTSGGQWKGGVGGATVWAAVM